MATPNPAAANNYDPRWFIWTIVFLVVTGISLVSYIVLSDNGTNDVPDLGTAHASAHAPTKTTADNATK